MQKVKIKLDYEPPPPDPPDTDCVICNGICHGWFRNIHHHTGLPDLCTSCMWDIPTRFLQKMNKDNMAGTGELGWTALAARAALWHLEKEIVRHATRHAIQVHRGIDR